MWRGGGRYVKVWLIATLFGGDLPVQLHGFGAVGLDNKNRWLSLLSQILYHKNMELSIGNYVFWEKRERLNGHAQVRPNRQNATKRASLVRYGPG